MLRHTLAMCLLVGCYQHHEIDRGPADSGDPDCGPEDTFVEGLLCPAGVFEVGETVSVELRHRVAICCGSGTSSASVGATEGTGRWTATAVWQACGCDELLDCLGPQDTSILRVGPLALGTNTVSAGPYDCTIEAEPAHECGAVEASFIAPRVLFDDQSFATTLVHEATADCECTPLVDVDGRDVDLRLCECGDACDAAFTTYSGSHVSCPWTRLSSRVQAVGRSSRRAYR